ACLGALSGESPAMGRQLLGWPNRVMRWLALALLAGACGCARTTVQGTVTYRGRPVTHGSVIFLSADRTVRSGVIGPTGTYTVTGVHPGPVKIGVISRYAPRAGADRPPGPVRPGKQPPAAPGA